MAQCRVKYTLDKQIEGGIYLAGLWMIQKNAPVLFLCCSYKLFSFLNP